MGVSLLFYSNERYCWKKYLKNTGVCDSTQCGEGRLPFVMVLREPFHLQEGRVAELQCFPKEWFSFVVLLRIQARRRGNRRVFMAGKSMLCLNRVILRSQLGYHHFPEPTDSPLSYTLSRVFYQIGKKETVLVTHIFFINFMLLCYW